ncbi:hypothetical protein I5Q34_24915 [Streptomyces sp. AV19]|uniref:hypothetical protein n=1 Tax=Streptomyces sp. AV19 TaxID=2793068 RepID=UPI0018FE2108|nr:hypothetical protein [Streptomyces sp. AV19]MBH1937472.1 hypothetical protein [Streptomyces sp. AV19]MDG4533755.1 hypothetical protein [Streptomyces sp. AV19]
MATAFPYFPSQDFRGDRLTRPVAERNARRSRGVAGRVTWAHSLWIDPELERLYGGDRHDPDVNRDRALRLGAARLGPSAPRPLPSLVSTSRTFLSRVTAVAGGDPEDEAFDLIRRTHSGYLCELAIGVIRSAPETKEVPESRTPFTAAVPRGEPVSRAAGLLASTARELLAQWYDAHRRAHGDADASALPPPDWAHGVFAASVRHEFCRRVCEEPGFTDGQRQEAAVLMAEAADALPPPSVLRENLPGGVQGSVVNELLSLSYPLWDRVRFCLDSPFDGLRSL